MSVASLWPQGFCLTLAVRRIILLRAFVTRRRRKGQGESQEEEGKVKVEAADQTRLMWTRNRICSTTRGVEKSYGYPVVDWQGQGELR